MAGEAVDVSKGARIRAFRREDIPGVASIGEESPEAASWTSENYETLDMSGGYLALVAETTGSVSGFVISRRMLDEGEILNLAVRRQDRRKGQGRALLSAALEQLQRGGVSRVYLEVRESNAAAIAFYQKQGFSKSGRRPGYYRDPAEAAILMEKNLTG